MPRPEMAMVFLSWLSAIAANAPELAGRVAGTKAAEVADRIAAGQTEKR